MKKIKEDYIVKYMIVRIDNHIVEKELIRVKEIKDGKTVYPSLKPHPETLEWLLNESNASFESDTKEITLSDTQFTGTGYKEMFTLANQYKWDNQKKIFINLSTDIMDSFIGFD